MNKQELANALQQYPGIFKLFDIDGSGHLDKQELNWLVDKIRLYGKALGSKEKIWRLSYRGKQHYPLAIGDIQRGVKDTGSALICLQNDTMWLPLDLVQKAAKQGITEQEPEQGQAVADDVVIHGQDPLAGDAFYIKGIRGDKFGFSGTIRDENDNLLFRTSPDPSYVNVLLFTFIDHNRGRRRRASFFHNEKGWYVRCYRMFIEDKNAKPFLELQTNPITKLAHKYTIYEHIKPGVYTREIGRIGRSFIPMVYASRIYSTQSSSILTFKGHHFHVDVRLNQSPIATITRKKTALTDMIMTGKTLYLLRFTRPNLPVAVKKLCLALGVTMNFNCWRKKRR